MVFQALKGCLHCHPLFLSLTRGSVICLKLHCLFSNLLFGVHPSLRHRYFSFAYVLLAFILIPLDLLVFVLMPLVTLGLDAILVYLLLSLVLQVSVPTAFILLTCAIPAFVHLALILEVSILLAFSLKVLILLGSLLIIQPLPPAFHQL